MYPCLQWQACSLLLRIRKHHNLLRAALYPGTTRRRARVFGEQRPSVRANHAKGVDLEGVFRPSASASSVSKAPHLQRISVSVTVAFRILAATSLVLIQTPLCPPASTAPRCNLQIN